MSNFGNEKVINFYFSCRIFGIQRKSEKKNLGNQKYLHNNRYNGSVFLHVNRSIRELDFISTHCPRAYIKNATCNTLKLMNGFHQKCI